MEDADNPQTLSDPSTDLQPGRREMLLLNTTRARRNDRC